MFNSVNDPIRTGISNQEDAMLNFFDDSFGGGKEIFATQNIQFNQINSQFLYHKFTYFDKY